MKSAEPRRKQYTHKTRTLSRFCSVLYVYVGVIFCVQDILAKDYTCPKGNFYSTESSTCYPCNNIDSELCKEGAESTWSATCLNLNFGKLYCAGVNTDTLPTGIKNVGWKYCEYTVINNECKNDNTIWVSKGEFLPAGASDIRRCTLDELRTAQAQAKVRYMDFVSQRPFNDMRRGMHLDFIESSDPEIKKYVDYVQMVALKDVNALYCPGIRGGSIQPDKDIPQGIAACDGVVQGANRGECKEEVPVQNITYMRQYQYAVLGICAPGEIYVNSTCIPCNSRPAWVEYAQEWRMYCPGSYSLDLNNKPLRQLKKCPRGSWPNADLSNCECKFGTAYANPDTGIVTECKGITLKPGDLQCGPGGCGNKPLYKQCWTKNTAVSYRACMGFDN